MQDDQRSHAFDLSEMQRLEKELLIRPAETLMKLQEKVAFGSAPSMLLLGDAYYAGRGVTKDLKIAEDYYQRACISGDWPYAKFNLGRFYMSQKRYIEARQEFEAEISLNYTPSIDFLGRLYFYGWGGARDQYKGEQLLRRAYKRGSVIAKIQLGRALMLRPFKFSTFFQGLVLRVSGFVQLYRLLNQRSRRGNQIYRF